MSTEHQKYSTENQAEAIRQYAARRGYDIVRTYCDKGKSGLRLDGRDGLKHLIDDVQRNRADFVAVIVYDVSRWGRFQDADESAYYEYICKRAGIRVEYCAEQFENDGSPVSTIVKGVKRAMAGEYSRELSAKVFAARFGSLTRAYRLIGYSPERDLRYVEINQKLRSLHPEILSQISEGICAHGGRVRLLDDSSTLEINAEFTAVVVIARCRTTASNSLRWIIRFEQRWEADLIVAVRMGTENLTARDYYLFPRFDLTGTALQLAESNGFWLETYRVDSLQPLFDLAARTAITELAA